MNDILDYITKNWIELLGAVLSLIYLYLSINEKVGLWLFGLLGAVLYVYVFFVAKLYADMSLQLYYVFVSIYGWIIWTRKIADSDNKLKISFLNKKQYLSYLLGTIVIYLIYLVVLKKFTDSPIPYMDSVVGALSVVATYMLAKKKIENWLVWIVVDAFAAGLYLYKQLHPTFVLYIVYTIMAVVGYYQWKKLMRK